MKDHNKHLSKLNRKPLRVAIAALLAQAGTIGSVDAASEFHVTGGLGAEYHTNSERVATNEESELTRIGSLGLTWLNKDSTVEGQADYLVTRRDYADNLQTDETTMDGRGELRWLA